MVVKVVNNGRDLGAHFNISGEARYGNTLTERMAQATGGAERLDKYRAPYEKKEKIARPKFCRKGSTVASSPL